MKEAFEKIRKRIEEITVDRNIHGSITGCNMGICEDDDCLKCLQKKVLSIVSEIEEEYINKSTEHINKSSDCSTNWILCSERLPEVHKKVFISYRGRNGIERNMGYISIYDRKWHFYQGKLVTGEVIAWIPMLLPEPYNPENGA